MSIVFNYSRSDMFYYLWKWVYSDMVYIYGFYCLFFIETSQEGYNYYVYCSYLLLFLLFILISGISPFLAKELHWANGIQRVVINNFMRT